MTKTIGLWLILLPIALFLSNNQPEMYCSYIANLNFHYLTDCGPLRSLRHNLNEVKLIVNTKGL